MPRTALLATATVCTVLLSASCQSSHSAQSALPSWQDGPARESIIDFVGRVSDEGGADYVPPAERIAVFDNDGTLWSEFPFYFQLAFAIDRVQALAPSHPEWSDTEPFASAIEGDVPGAMAGGLESALQLVMASHAGMTSEEFQAAAGEWLRTARHPGTGELYADMVYLPMLELLDYLRANEFKTFIVSGGGVDFLRAFAERTYGIPPEQVVGTRIAASYELRDGQPVIVKNAEVEFVDDKAGKPVGIHHAIGRRPILAGGNSDGDLQMLQYTTIGSEHPSLALIVHHTDAAREFAYDRDSHVGQLDAALDEAAERGWTVVDMRTAWTKVFAWE